MIGNRGTTGYVDKRLTCSDCGQTFPFSATEQQDFARLAYRPPRRCPCCRHAKHQRGGSRPIVR